MRLMIGFVAAVLLSGCGLSPPTAAQRRAAAFDVPENRPHPRGVVSSFPPADVSFSPLRCRPNGEDTVCTRDDN